MKRILTLFCALVLLISCMSGAVVQASAAEGVLPSRAVAETAVSAEGELESIAVGQQGDSLGTILPKTYSTTLEQQLGQAFIDYVQGYIARCAYEIPVSQFNVHANNFSLLTDIIYYEAPELFSPASISGSYDRDTGYITTLRVDRYQEYADTPEEYADCLDVIRESADYLVKGVEGNEDLTDVEKALILHDRLAVWTEYDLGFDNKTIYSAVGPLMYQTGVCQGYSLAYTYLLQRVGIESDMCISKTLNHSWNILYIDNVAYHVDVTWDDPTNNPGDPFYDNLGRVDHKNFLLSTSGIWNTGHMAFDYNSAPRDTRYDNTGWWRSAKTAIQLVENKLYYMDKDTGIVYEVKNVVPDQSIESIKIYDPQLNPGFSMARLASAGKRLLVSREKDVVSFSPASPDSASVVYAPDFGPYTNAYIEGMKYEHGRIVVQINDALGGAYRENKDYEGEPDPVTILTQPQSAVAEKGKSAKITVKAAGDGLTYTWYYKSAGASKFKKSSVTSDAYVVKMSSGNTGRQVYCVIKDQYGNKVQTDTVTLTLGKFAKITKQPGDGVAEKGGTAKVTVKASGDGLSYTWYYKNKKGTEFKKSSVKTATYSVKMSSSVNGRQIYCVVKDQYGNEVQTKTVTLQQVKFVKVTQQPTSTAVEKGKTAKVTVKATGDDLTYTWYYKSAKATKFKKSSVKTATYSVKMSSSVNGRQIYCLVKDPYGNSVQTETVTLKLAVPAKITQQPKDALAAKGQTATVTIKASGDGLSYTWYYKLKGATAWKKAAVTTNTFVSGKMSEKLDGCQVQCKVKDAYGNTVKSDVVNLDMGSPASIVTQPKNVTVASGKTAKVTLKAAGNGLTYTWYYKLKGATAWKKASADTEVFAVKMSKTFHGCKVQCVVTDRYGNTVKTNAVTLKQK